MTAAVALLNSFVSTRSDLVFGRNAAVAGTWIMVAAVCLGALLVAPGVTHLTAMSQDVFGYVDGAYRISKGQIPHVDYHTPIGAVNYYSIYVAYSITGNFGSALPLASLITLFALMPAILYVLPRYFSVFSAVTIGTSLILLILAPMNVGELPSSITWAMSYNRMGWAALTILFLHYVLPDANDRRRVIGDGVFIAFIVSFCFYTKITYAAVAVGYLGLLCLLRPAARPAIAGGLALTAVVALAVEAATSLHGPYFADLERTLLASSAVQGGAFGLVKPALKNLSEIMLVVAAVSIAVVERLVGPRELVWAAAVCCASLAILNQNFQTNHLPALVALLALLVERAANEARTPGASRVRRMAPFAAILLAFVAQPTVNQAGALYRHLAAATEHQVAQGVPRTLAKFSVADVLDVQTRWLWLKGDYDTLRHYTSPRQSLFQKEYFESILSGIILLKEHDCTSKSISVFDEVDPITFALSLPPARGNAAISVYGRTFNATWFTPPWEFLADVDLVLIPSHAVNPVTRDALVNMYSPWLMAHYRRLGENKYWALWGRDPRT